MSSKRKKEEVSISFHYLVHEQAVGNNEYIQIPFTTEDFKAIYNNLSKIQVSSISDDETEEKIRYRLLAVVKSVEEFDNRYVCGVYKASYWGHSFDNSVHGKIPADSLNLRQFFFLLYLSESGKIYIASQYLGNFGGYTAIKNTIISSFSTPHRISAKSFNLPGIHIENASAKKVEISFSKKGQSISSSNIWGKSGAITFKKQSKDDGFEAEVASKLLSHIQKTPDEIKKIITGLLKDSNLMEMNDDDIEDCKIIARLNRKEKVIHLLDESNYASRFQVDVPFDLDGHPEYKPLKEKVISLLKTEIIAKKENV